MLLSLILRKGYEGGEKSKTRPVPFRKVGMPNLFELFHQEYPFSASSSTYSKGGPYRPLKHSQLSLMTVFLVMLVSYPGGNFCFLAAQL